MDESKSRAENGLVESITEAVLTSPRMLSWGSDLRGQLGSLEARVQALEKYIYALKASLSDEKLALEVPPLASLGKRIEKAVQDRTALRQTAVERLKNIERR